MANVRKGTKTGRKSAKQLGQWKIKRVGDDQILLTIPEGMEIQGTRLSLEDVMAAGANYQVVKKGRALACCSGNIAIA